MDAGAVAVRDEYDLRGGERGKYAQRYRRWSARRNGWQDTHAEGYEATLIGVPYVCTRCDAALTQPDAWVGEVTGHILCLDCCEAEMVLRALGT